MHVVLFGPGAAQVAQSAAMREALAGQSGQPWIIDPVESSQNWGAASTHFAQALMDHHAVAVIALDRDTSHLAAQLALKCFVPVVALSDDTTLTSANVPWVFRLTAKTEPAAALRLLEEAASRGSADPWRIRDLLASGNTVAGLSFLPTGEIRR
jgi:adenine/guanine phosphoribosyltransferase-like PRPP-binding protein